MSIKSIFISIILSILLSIISCKDSIKLKDITVLNFQNNLYTTGRRSQPVLQLKCLSGCENKIYSAMCKNTGFDGNDVTWKCEADLNNNVRFGLTQVTCEGYNYPDDEYVLYGSCGLEYSLVNIGGNNNYDSHYETNNNFDSYGNNNNYDFDYNKYKHSNSSIWKWISSILSSIIMIGVVVTILICMFCCRNDSQAHYGNNGGGYGGAPPPNNGPGYPGANSFGTGFSTSSSAGSNNGPGFFTGAGIGGLAGYMMGRNNNYGYNQGYNGYQGGYNGYQGGWGDWGAARNFGFGGGGVRPSYNGSRAPSTSTCM